MGQAAKSIIISKDEDYVILYSEEDQPLALITVQNCYELGEIISPTFHAK